MTTGLIYFIRQDTRGPIKVGFTTTDPARRVCDLQTGNPYPLWLMPAQIVGTTFTEACFHAHFERFQLVGEWFRPNDDLIRVANGRMPLEFVRKLGGFEYACGDHLAGEPPLTEPIRLATFRRGKVA